MSQERRFEEALRAVLRGERAVKAVTLVDLAVRTGISRGNLQRYLTPTIADGRRLTLDAMRRIADGLDVTVTSVVQQAEECYDRMPAMRP